MCTRVLKILLINILHHYLKLPGGQTDESDNQARNYLGLDIGKDLKKPPSFQGLNIETGRKALEQSDISSNPAAALQLHVALGKSLNIL